MELQKAYVQQQVSFAGFVLGLVRLMNCVLTYAYTQAHPALLYCFGAFGLPNVVRIAVFCHCHPERGPPNPNSCH